MRIAERPLEVLQWLGLAVLMAAMPLANFLMSIGILILCGVWILLLISDKQGSKDPWTRWNAFRHTPAAVRFSLIYVIFLITLLWTDDWTYGLKDLKTKLPILILPLILTGLNPISERQERGLLKVFIGSLIVTVTICLMVRFEVYNQWAVPMGFRVREVNNFRDVSIFISHIRFSLLLVMGIVILLFRFPRKGISLAVIIAITAYFLYFLWAIESITAFAIMIVLALSFASWKLYSSVGWRVRLLSACVALAVLIGSVWFVIGAYYEYFDEVTDDLSALDVRTPYGEPYAHYTNQLQVENGHYTMIYIAWGELASEWQKRSSIAFEGQDSLGNPVKGTLIRYLTSKGLRKDIDGVRSLTEADISWIEQGITNAEWMQRTGIRKRLDRIFFEYDNYRNGGDPNGHSVFQRLEFWNTGWAIVSKNRWLGVGVGDVKAAFRAEYEQRGSPLVIGNRLRAHSQWLTFWITSGLIGFLAFLVLWSSLFRRSLSARSVIFVAYFLIVSLSFLTEDTLESQAGVTFFAFFGSFILFLPKKQGAIEPPSRA